MHNGQDSKLVMTDGFDRPFLSAIVREVKDECMERHVMLCCDGRHLWKPV
jgi:hypothetical protein